MGFSNGYVASIILKNKPLREFQYNGKRTVKVPFGSEYVIRLKNKSKDPALVEVSIDGTDVLNGSQLVLKAGESIDLERFVDNNSKGKKFKYISLEEGASTGEIDDPYREENGLVRVKFHKAFYLPKSLLTTTTLSTTVGSIPHDPFISSSIKNPFDSRVYFASNVDNSAIKSRGLTSDSFTFDSCAVAVAGCATNSDLSEDKGATVEGSESSQEFSNTSEYHSLGVATTIDIYVVGPNYKELPDNIEWGVYLNSRKEPVATFKDKKHAHLFAGNADFGRAIVIVKEIV